MSDYELTTLAAGLPPSDGDFDRVLTPMARELLAARKVIASSRVVVEWAEPVTDGDWTEYDAAILALREYDAGETSEGKEMSQITDDIAKWPQGGPQHSAARLRTADAVAKERADTVDWLFACFPALTEVLTAEQIASIGQGGADARAYLAAREKER